MNTEFKIAQAWSKKLIEYATSLSSYHDELDKWNQNDAKLDWVRRFDQFASRYSNGDKRKCSHMLKHVSLWKYWIDLEKSYVDIDWSDVVEERYDIDVSSIGGDACSGGACDISASLANAIKDKTKERDKKKTS